MYDKPLHAETFPKQKDQFLESRISLWGLDKPFLKAAEFNIFSLSDTYLNLNVLISGDSCRVPLETCLKQCLSPPPHPPPLLCSFSERRHSSSSKPSLAVPPTSVFSFFPSLSKSKGGSGSGSSRSSSGGVLSASSLSSKLLKSPKEKLQLRGNRPMHPIQQNRVPHGRM